MFERPSLTFWSVDNMWEMSQFNRNAVFLMVWTVVANTIGFPPEARAEGSDTLQESGSSRQATSEGKPKLDRSGRKRVGEASFYAEKFAGRKMADGAPMDPYGDNAASKTLPLGTTAKVTNLDLHSAHRQRHLPAISGLGRKLSAVGAVLGERDAEELEYLDL